VKPNRTKAKLMGGELAIGSFLYVPSSKLAEILALCGYDFVVIDQEHGPISIETAEDMVRACELADCTPLVRVGHLHSHAILQALDAGAQGVHIPAVNTSDQARDAVSLCKYAPLGHRGLAFVRAGSYGMKGKLSDYCRRANEEVLVIVHIEELAAIDNLDKLLEVENVDVYYLGPTDLSNSLGLPGGTSPELKRIIDDAIIKIVGAGRIAGIIVNDSQDARRYVDMGVRYLATHAVRFMSAGVHTFLKELRGLD
jgi:2-keto-3-deoxy-L-rhamnonate aldolase RhmA